MAVTKGNTSSNSGNTSSLTISHTRNASSDLIVVGLCLEGSITASGGVDYGSTAMTLLRRDSNAGVSTTEIWYLEGISTDETITATLSAKGQNIGGAVDFSGADTPNNATGSTPDGVTSVSNTVTGAETGNFCFDCVREPNGSLTVGADQNQEWSITAGGERGGGSTQAGVDGGVMSWTWTASADAAHTACLIPAAAGEVLAADVGVYLLTGTDTPLEITMPADPGAYTLDGTDADFDLIMPADVGVYLLTGTDAGLSKSVVIAADPGAYTLTGTDTPLDITMPADAGAYVLAGTEADLLYSRVIDAAVGAYAVAGTDTPLDIAMPADPGAYVLAGTDATLVYRVLTADPGSYSVTGTDADLDLIMPADVGAYVLAGTDADLIHTQLDVASFAYPLSYLGSFTPMAASTFICFTAIEDMYNRRRFDVSGPADRAKYWGEMEPIEELMGEGYIYDADDATRPLGMNYQLSLGGVILREVNFMIRKTWPLFEITGPGDGEYGAGWMDPIYTFSVDGWLRDNGPQRESTNLTFIFDHNTAGDLTFAEFLMPDTVRSRWRRMVDGRTRISVSGRFEGAPTYVADAGGFDLSWLFKDPPGLDDDPPEGTVVLDFGGGGDAEVISHNAIMYDIALRGTFRGGNIRVDSKIRMNKV